MAVEMELAIMQNMRYQPEDSCLCGKSGSGDTDINTNTFASLLLLPVTSNPTLSTLGSLFNPRIGCFPVVTF